MTNATPFYLAVIWELRKHIIELGATMKQCDDVSGNMDGYTAKMLHPEAPSGRQAQWRTLQNLVDSLYPFGFEIRIRPKGSNNEIRAVFDRKLAKNSDKLSGLSRVQKEANRGLLGHMPLRDLARDAGRKGGLARAQNQTPNQRARLARKAAKARWAAIEKRGAEIAAVIEKGSI